MHATKYSEQAVVTPLGRMVIRSDGTHITNATFSTRTLKTSPDAITKKCAKELVQFFSGTQNTFNVPLKPQGTDFQKAVWKKMCNVPWGKTVSYVALANDIDRPRAVRAVGSACGKNPILVLIPCHRIVGSRGLGGFSAGLHRKKKLLAHEQIAMRGTGKDS